MKLKNTTDWPDWFLRRMAGWCRRKLGVSAGDLKQAVFRNSRAAWGGAAWIYPRRITVCVGHAGHFPAFGHRHANGHQNRIADRTECLVWVTIHEVAHLGQAGARTRSGGNPGGSEIATERAAAPVLAEFRELREALCSEWLKPPVLASPPPSLMDNRRAKAVKDLARWQRKLKLAKTKVQKLERRVKYYEQPAEGVEQ
jgi:hypothetical protein